MRLGLSIQKSRYSTRAKAGVTRCMTVSEIKNPSKSASTQTLTCRRCKQQFVRDQNHAHACRYHSAIFTGGEISKRYGYAVVGALGFCRASAAPEHQLLSVVGTTGIISFWDCCGSEDPEAPGCCTDYHRSYDDVDE